MQNVLTNVLKTSGLHGEQPWKQYYKGIKPSNPLGGDIVRRMGNKVKGVLPASNTRNLQFMYMTDIAIFKAPRSYIPPYKPLPGQEPQYYTVNQTSPPYYYSNQPYSEQSSPNYNESIPSYPQYMPFSNEPPLTYREMRRYRREEERSASERRREGRRAVADTRANYRSGLDTAREVRNWSKTLGLI